MGLWKYNKYCRDTGHGHIWSTGPGVTHCEGCKQPLVPWWKRSYRRLQIWLAERGVV